MDLGVDLESLLSDGFFVFFPRQDIVEQEDLIRLEFLEVCKEHTSLKTVVINIVLSKTYVVLYPHLLPLTCHAFFLVTSPATWRNSTMSPHSISLRGFWQHSTRSSFRI